MIPKLFLDTVRWMGEYNDDKYINIRKMNKKEFTKMNVYSKNECKEVQE